MSSRRFASNASADARVGNDLENWRPPSLQRTSQGLFGRALFFLILISDNSDTHNVRNARPKGGSDVLRGRISTHQDMGQMRRATCVASLTRDIREQSRRSTATSTETTPRRCSRTHRALPRGRQGLGIGAELRRQLPKTRPSNLHGTTDGGHYGTTTRGALCL